MICGLGSGVVESGNKHFRRGPSAPRAQSSAPTLDTSTWCGVPSHPWLPCQPAETEGAGPDTGGHSRAIPGLSSVWVSQMACWGESVGTGCLCFWGPWMVHGTGWKMRRSHMEGAKPRAQNPEGSGSQLLTPSHQLCFSADPSVSLLGKWTHWLPDLRGASMTSSSFSEETLLTLTHAATLQPPHCPSPRSLFLEGQSSPTGKATDSSDGQAILAWSWERRRAWAESLKKSSWNLIRCLRGTPKFSQIIISIHSIFKLPRGTSLKKLGTTSLSGDGFVLQTWGTCQGTAGVPTYHTAAAPAPTLWATFGGAGIHDPEGPSGAGAQGGVRQSFCI